LDVEPRGFTRLPSYTLFDLGLRKTIKVDDNLSMKPNLDLYNVLNSDTIVSRITQYGPTYGRVSAMIPGRMIRFGLDLSF
jgi:hypothetical protein